MGDKAKLVFYEVQWSDAEAETGWQSIEDVKAPSKLTKSYGFFIKQDSRYFTIAACYDEETGHFNRFMHIPQQMLKRKRKLTF